MISASELFTGNYDAAVRLLTERAREGERSFFVTPNVDQLVKLRSDARLVAAYREADFWFLDSAPLQIYYWMRGRNIPRVTGADLFMPLLSELLKANLPIVFILSNQAVSNALKAFCAGYNRFDVELYVAPESFDPYSTAANQIVDSLNQRATKANVFIGLGAPKQETLALRLVTETSAALIVGCVGAAPEFAMGLKKRAPVLMRKLGLEWLFRIWTEPRRLLRRYFWEDLAILPLLLGIVRLNIQKEPKREKDLV